MDGFIRTIRAPDLSLHLTIAAKYQVGRHEITYDAAGDISGRDRLASGTQTIDGRQNHFGLGFVGGRVYGQHPDGQWEAVADPAGAAAFASSFLRLDDAVILGDLGKAEAETPAGYRLRVTAGLSLTPVQFNDNTIGNPHDRTDRLEIVVDDRGVPLGAKYTVSIAGTIEGADVVAHGEADLTFSMVGAPITIPPPGVASGAPLPDPIASPAQAVATWQTYTSATGHYTTSFPGFPTETTAFVANPNLGPILTHHVSSIVSDGSCCVINDGTFPESYIQRVGVDTVLMEGGNIEVAKNNGQLIGVVAISIHGLVGKEFIIATPTKLLRFREFLVGRVGVELVVGGTPEQIGSATADQFLGSISAATP
jgi:hypothetical protein